MKFWIRKSIFSLRLSFVCLILSCCATASGQSLINFRGNPVYLNGVNLPWNNYGWDIGRHPSRGVSYDPEWFEEAFERLSSAGANTARVFLHGDGRASPEFNAAGDVIGLDPEYFVHLDDLIQRAEAHGIYLIISLWSFEIAQDLRACCGRFAGNHSDLIRDPIKTQQYIDLVLIPMLERYRNSCSLFAWEIMNEPEWTIDGIGEKGDLVKLDELQRFVGMLAAAIHRNSEHLVTLGSASLKWNSMYSPPCKGNYWGDHAIQAAFQDEEAYLDFYQIHFYDWMKEGFANFDPFSRPTDFWLLDKPTLIGEAPIWSEYYSPSEMSSHAYLNGFAGNLLWAYAFNGLPSGFSRVQNALRLTAEMHKDWVQFTCNPLTVTEESFTVSQHPIPFGMPLIIESSSQFPQQIQLSLKDLAGRQLLELYQEVPAGKYRFQVPLRLRASGMYLLQINRGPYRKILVL